MGYDDSGANLIYTSGDAFSPLSGKELVQKQKVIADWPTTIIFSGFEIGVEILTGLPLINNSSIQNSPVKDVFALSIPFDPQDKNGRMSWDETAVLVAVRGWECKALTNTISGKSLNFQTFTLNISYIESICR